MYLDGRREYIKVEEKFLKHTSLNLKNLVMSSHNYKRNTWSLVFCEIHNLPFAISI